MGACTTLGTRTPVLGLCKPVDGESNWGESYRQNMDILDQLAGGPSIAVGSYAVRGLRGQNDGSNPNTVFGISAELVVLRNPNTGIVRVRKDVATQSVNFAIPGAGGLDTGALASNSWYHLYFISGTEPDAALASLVPPPTGPALPAGYTGWAYAGSVRSNPSGQLIQTLFRGAWAFYRSSQTAIGDGKATVETAVSLSALVPPNALRSQASVMGSLSPNLTLRLFAGVDWVTQFGGGSLGNLVIPNVGQQVYYLWQSTPAVGIFLAVVGYCMPNGGE